MLISDRPELDLYRWLSHWLMTFWLALMGLVVGFFAIRAWWHLGIRRENFARLEQALGQNAIEKMVSQRDDK